MKSDSYGQYGVWLKFTPGGVKSHASLSCRQNNPVHEYQRKSIIGSATKMGMFILGSVLIKQYGLNGAGVASIVSLSVMNGWRWYSIRRIAR